MNLQDIWDLANSLIDDDIEEEHLFLWINECSDDLANSVYKYDSYDIPHVDPEEVTLQLPGDFVELINLYYNDGPLTDIGKYSTYELLDDFIKLNEKFEPGIFTIDYYRSLRPMLDLDDVPEIPQQFHRLYALWCGARFWKNYGDELEAETMLMQEYLAGKEKLAQHMSKRISFPFHRTRDVLPRAKFRGVK